MAAFYKAALLTGEICYQDNWQKIMKNTLKVVPSLSQTCKLRAMKTSTSKCKSNQMVVGREPVSVF
jgi:hypothetical protein